MLITGHIVAIEHAEVQSDTGDCAWIFVEGKPPFRVPVDMLMAVTGRRRISEFLRLEVCAEVGEDMEATRIRFGPFENTADTVVPLRPAIAAVEPEPLDETIKTMLAKIDAFRAEVAAGKISAFAGVVVRRDGTIRTDLATKAGMSGLAMVGAVHMLSVEVSSTTADTDVELPGGDTIG